MLSIYKKELQSFFYTPFAYILAALFMFLFTYMFNTGIGDMESNVYEFSFAGIFYNVIFYFIFLVPIITMRTFADERKFGTEVLLMTSPVNVAQIVLGKFLANITVFLFMILGSTLFPIVTAIKGEVVVSQLVCAYIGFFCWGAMYIAIGMLISSFTENSIIAAIVGEIVMFAFLFVDDFAQTGFIAQYPKLHSALYAFAAQPRFEYFSQGFIRLSDIVFFASAIIVALVWNYISLEKRRWNKG
ncbi:MAG: ABC transporter permease subunit [Ruminococcus sp.]|nr:ABC transporter permease subunit [Ruminococcus sp.]MBQ8122310.1 ABC transporter permease subunit [Ruminococcus sp.]HBB19457.1 ABC transporter permease [Ruminococcus sp.]HOO06128.1 ABC transporter permease [Ruminococcus sp.]